MEVERAYVLDTSSLIDIKDHFQAELRRIGRFARSGRTKIPIGVRRELRPLDDSLYRAVDKWIENGAGVDFTQNPRAMALFTEFQRKYGDFIQLGDRRIPGYFKSRRGRRTADTEVVAIGKAMGLIVVSDDHAIKASCLLENVECISWQELLRRIRATEQTLNI